MKKKILALILAAATSVTMLTGTVMADGQTAGTESLSAESQSGSYDTELTPVGSTFTSDGIMYQVTSLTEAEAESVESSSNPTDVKIPSSVTYEGDSYKVTAIGDGAFAGLGSTVSLTIPSTVTSIGSGAMLSSLESITLEDGNASFFLQDGVLYQKTDAGNELVLYPAGSSSVSCAIPDGTVKIRANAFYGAKNLLTVVIPSSVTTIEEKAFASFANPAAIAFDTETAPSSVSGKAFELTAAGNIFYFKNAQVLRNLQGNASNFAGSSDVTYVTDGIPASVQAIAGTASSVKTEGSLLTAAGDDAGLSDGYYVIHSAVNAGYVLDLNNGLGSLSNFANIDVYAANSSAQEIFKVTKTDAANNLYTFTSAYSSKVIDVAGRGVTDGTNLQQYESNGTIAQQFRILQTDQEGVYSIQCGYSSLVMDLSGALAENGRNVQMWTTNGTLAQHWTFEAVADPTQDALPAGVYSIHTSVGAANSTDASTRALDIKNGSLKNFANVQVYDSNGSNAQKFLFVPLGNNLYLILNAYTRRAVDVAGGSHASGANVQMYEENDTAAQIWRVAKTADGYYSITNSASGMSLDISGGISANERNIQIWEPNGSAAQKWVLAQASPASVSGYYTIASAANRNEVFDITEASLNNGAQLQIFHSAGNNAQKFQLNPVADYTFVFENIESGKVLDIPGGAYAVGNVIQQYTANGTAAQQFTLVASGDNEGSYYIQTLSGLRLGVSNASEHAKVSLVDAKDGDVNQKWYLQATDLNDGWQTLYGGYYYVVNGQIMKNAWVGNAYVDENGAAYEGWHSAPSNHSPYLQGYYYYFDGTKGAQSDARPYIKLLFGTKSSTFTYNNGGSTGTMTQTGYDCHYTIYVDRANCLVTVYTTYPGTTAVNLPIWEFKTSPGISGTDRETNAGHTTTYFKDNWFELMGPSYGQYVTLINTAGEYFHSIPGGEANDHNVDASTYNKLGTQQSHGCCRLCVRNAYWLYAFCWMGTDIYVGDNYAHPIDTYYQPKMTEGQWIDPTDVHYTGNYGYVDNGVYYGYHG